MWEPANNVYYGFSSIVSAFYLYRPTVVSSYVHACRKRGCLYCAVLSVPWGELVLVKFEVNSQKLGGQAPQNFLVWIGNCNVKVWKSTEEKLHNTWRTVKIERNEHTPALSIASNSCHSDVTSQSRSPFWVRHPTSDEWRMWGKWPAAMLAYIHLQRCHTRGESWGTYLIYTSTKCT